MHTPGFMSMLLILAIAVLMFGGKKLPELGGALGEAIKNFKKGIKDEESTPANQSTDVKPVVEPPKQIPQIVDEATKEPHISDSHKT